MNLTKEILPYRIGQRVRAWTLDGSLVIRSLYKIGGEWRADVSLFGRPEKTYGFMLDELWPENDREYPFTKTFQTMTGRTLCVIEGGK